ncbi:SPRY domain-containing SOCS box protein 4-like [Heptranchias perlo]|uniref:SPRY domain-containing SOCS box protein 4-like n=1 Tax=Heptranchias perlo TaxID=212740 RepID=UPI0035596DA2
MGLMWFKSGGEKEVSPSEGTGQFQGLGVPMPASLDLLLDLPRAPREVRIRHTWSSWDCSPNVCPAEEEEEEEEEEDEGEDGGLTACRRPAADSTDCMRGKVGYRRGLHVWRVGWPSGQRGSHASVGVGTAGARLQSAGYRVLLGGEDGESWGWELGGNRLHHAGRPGRRYPGNRGGPLTVPESFLAVLDSDEGTLSFLVDGEFLGVAFAGLKGKTLYPMVSCVWGNTNISLTYINGLDRQPLTLADLCRRRIRLALGKDRIAEAEALPLPRAIKTYLQRP